MMTGRQMSPTDHFRMQADGLDSLIALLLEQDYTVIGPTINNQVIGYHPIESASDLPQGWTEVQDQGQYRIQKRGDKAYFGFNVGPHSWKQFLFPAKETLWRAKKTNQHFEILAEKTASKKMAFIGVRSCDLHAIAIQDKVFIQDTYQNTTYQLARENIFIVAVNCTQSSKTCFCTSMQTGPKVTFGYDIVLTEILDDDAHYFVGQVGSQQGDAIVKQISYQQASQLEIGNAQKKVEYTAQHMEKQMDVTDIKALLYRNHDSKVWETVADRCLACTNCTLVCPTCFCSKVEDTVDLSGNTAERTRSWDSCFNVDFSYIHGGSVRDSIKSRYRQWMTHKLASWIDQFGMSGCVGCGRCITWCPVGIDITEEVQAIRDNETNEDNDA